MCHLCLRGEGRIRGDPPDEERLTDLLTVFFGFGSFTTNAAMRFARNNRGYVVVSRGELDDRDLNAADHYEGYRSLGYLSPREFGYALACYCWIRAETEPPAWTRHVDPGPRVHLEQGLDLPAPHHPATRSSRSTGVDAVVAPPVLREDPATDSAISPAFGRSM